MPIAQPAMDQRSLGGGLRVPAVGMGTWRTLDVRGAAPEAARAAVVDAALRAGANLFDSSPMYGESERVLGAALAGRRDEAIVATKVWASSAAEGREQVERALAVFGGRVDVYQVHNLLAWQEHLPYLEELRDRGLVRVVGATHYQRSAFGALASLMQTGRLGMVQLPYNAADRTAERELLPLAAELGLGVLVMQPLGEGALVRHQPAAAELAPLERFGVTTWPQALLKWCLSDPRVTAVIPATTHVERMTANAMAGRPPWFDDEARERVAGLARR